MDGLSPNNIATRKGSTAVEVSLKFDLPTVNVCTGEFLEDLADVIVSSVGRTDKRLLRLSCSRQIVKVQILNTYVPVKSLLSSGDVARELQRQLSYPESPFLSNATGVDATFRPQPVQVINCSELSPFFESSCATRAPPPQKAWLGLEPNSAATIAIFAATAVLLLALIAICGMCVRKLWQDNTQVDKKAKWIVAVQKEQASELAKQSKQSKECLPETPPTLPQLPPSLPSTPLSPPFPSKMHFPPPLPSSTPPATTLHFTHSPPNTTLYHVEYEENNDLIDMDTPLSGDAYEGNAFVLEEIVLAEEEEEEEGGKRREGEEDEADCLNTPPATVTAYIT